MLLLCEACRLKGIHSLAHKSNHLGRESFGVFNEIEEEELVIQGEVSRHSYFSLFLSILILLFRFSLNFYFFIFFIPVLWDLIIFILFFIFFINRFHLLICFTISFIFI